MKKSSRNRKARAQRKTAVQKWAGGENEQEVECRQPSQHMSGAPTGTTAPEACEKWNGSLAFHPAFMAAMGPHSEYVQGFARRVDLAVEAIARACARQPDQSELINGAFAILVWRMPLPPTDGLFAAHIDELLQRVVEGTSVAPATRAEVLTILCMLSLKGPLDQPSAALMAILMRDLLKVDLVFESQKRATESCPGANDELLQSIRDRLCFSDRVYPKKEQAA